MKNKKLLVGGISLALIGLGSLSLISKPTYKLIDNSNFDSEKIAVYIKNESGNYEKSNSIPTSGYVLNTEKSTCNNGTTPSWNKSSNSLKLNNLSGNTSCYLYFDEELTAEDMLAKLNITSVNTTIPNFSQTAETDEGIFKVEDGMYGGYSYYWRGATTTNYLKFAGKCWRIIRINGDGSIRLLYDGTTCHANGENTTDSIAVMSQSYNSSEDNSSYVGWTYTVSSQRPILSADVNGLTTGGTASNAKMQTEIWFNSAITGDNLEKVADGKFCNDRNTGELVSGLNGSWSTTWSATGTYFLYAAYSRMDAGSPTLSCDIKDVYTLKAGAITADEVMYAGGMFGNNKSYYLYNKQNYSTMSPSSWSSTANVFLVNSGGYLFDYWASGNEALSYNIRPVINLKSDVTFVSGGNGTLNNPYVVEGAE